MSHQVEKTPAPTQEPAPPQTQPLANQAATPALKAGGYANQVQRLRPGKRAGYNTQTRALAPSGAPVVQLDEDKTADNGKLTREIEKAAEKGGDDDYVRDTITDAHLKLATAAQKAGMIVNLLDGATGDEDEAKILMILRYDPNGTLAALKAGGNLDWLFDDMDGAEYDQLMAIDASEIKARRIQKLLSRNVVDWVVSASECRQVIAILKGAPKKERALLIGRIISADLLMNFLKNVDPADRDANLAIFAEIPPHLRVNVLLSYQFILDWVVTDAEASYALDILLTVPKGQITAVLQKVKVDKLLAELADSDRSRLAGLVANCTDPPIKAKLLKAYRHGETDEAYKKKGSDKTGVAKEGTHTQIDKQVDDTMAGYTTELAGAKDKKAQDGVKTKYAGKLDTVDTAMKKKLALEKKHGIYLDAEPQATIYVLANLDTFEKLLVELPLRGQPKTKVPDHAKALGWLLGLDKKHLDGFMPWLELAPLLDVLPKADRPKVKPLSDATKDAGQAAQLYAALYKAKAADKSAGADAKITEKGVIETSAATEIDAEIKVLTDAYMLERPKVQHDKAKLAKLNKEFKAKLDAVVKRKELELDIEFQYNVNITNTADRQWKLSELERIKKTFEKLPLDHVRDNTDVKELRRARVSVDGAGVEEPNVGGDHGGPLVRVFDTGLTGGYRYGGATSKLGEHKSGDKAPTDPLHALQEVLTHEIGHGVHDKYATEFTKFKAAVGWDKKNKADTKAQLVADGKGAGAADTFIADLDASRNKNYTERPEKVYKGKVYVVDPYNASKYLIRTAGTIPGDKGADDSADMKAKFGYARSNEKDHFAEVYMQFVEVPEEAYKNLVARPTARYEASKKSHTDAKTAHDTLKATKGHSATELAKLKTAMDKAKTKMDADKASMDAHVAQWTIVRDEVFKTGSKEAAALATLQTAADTHKADAVKHAAANGKVATFKVEVKKCATPHQVELLRAETEAAIRGL